MLLHRQLQNLTLVHLGQVPEQVSQLTGLTCCKFLDCGLSGSSLALPATFSRLTNLQELCKLIDITFPVFAGLPGGVL